MIWFNRAAVAGVRCRPTLRTTRTGRRPAHMHAQGSTVLMQASEAHIGRVRTPPRARVSGEGRQPSHVSKMS